MEVRGIPRNILKTYLNGFQMHIPKSGIGGMTLGLIPRSRIDVSKC